MCKKILLVEHQLYEATQTQLILKNLGYQVCLVQLGILVSERIAEFNPDLILLHTELGDTNSFELCRLLKSNHNTRLIPIIMFGKDNLKISNAIKAYEVGADFYCNKDVKIATTLGILTRLLFEHLSQRVNQHTGQLQPSTSSELNS